MISCYFSTSLKCHFFDGANELNHTIDPFLNRGRNTTLCGYQPHYLVI